MTEVLVWNYHMLIQYILDVYLLARPIALTPAVFPDAGVTLLWCVCLGDRCVYVWVTGVCVWVTGVCMFGWQACVCLGDRCVCLGDRCVYVWVTGVCVWVTGVYMFGWQVCVFGWQVLYVWVTGVCMFGWQVCVCLGDRCVYVWVTDVYMFGWQVCVCLGDRCVYVWVTGVFCCCCRNLCCLPQVWEKTSATVGLKRQTTRWVSVQVSSVSLICLVLFSPFGWRSSELMASLCISHAQSTIIFHISETVEDLVLQFGQDILRHCY